MELLPLDKPELIEVAAQWLGREENYRWLDFGDDRDRASAGGGFALADGQ